MKRYFPTRCGGVLAGVMLAGSLPLGAQAPVKPSAAVSSLPAAQPTSAAPESSPVATAEPVHQLQVEFSNGNLAVNATNASLNEILREVGKKTGMKITGSASDDRVFGHYGPSKPAVVLDALLDGTGNNMLLVDDAKGKSELILTTRRGGVSPPSANSQPQQPDPDDSAGQYVAPTRPYQPPTPNGRSVGFAPPNQDGTPQANETGDGPKTPQQIYDQLQRQMQQKQTQTPPPQ